MNRSRLILLATCLLFVVIFLPSCALADTNCEEGNGQLNPAQPQSITPEQIIQRFAAKEEIFKEARNHYTYTQEIIVQELDGDTVDGEFKETTDILYDDQGKRLEEVKYAPQPTLKRILMTREDFDDFRNRLPFVLTTDDLGQYNILYAGQQGVDELQTYVFDVAPKHIDKDKRYFQGRIWVDNRDFQIVKTCGKNVPDTHKKNNENLTPKFVTYREQIDGQYWFPTYTRADDILQFSTGGVHVREIVKYENYKRFQVKSRITFKGQVPDKDAPK
jgi:outer membrane lipoprotein-sorting protein